VSVSEAGVFQGFPPSGSTRCPRCWRDLTGQTAVGRCPECGTAFDGDCQVWSRPPFTAGVAKYGFIALLLIAAVMLGIRILFGESLAFELKMTIFSAGLISGLATVSLLALMIGTRQMLAVTRDSVFNRDLSGAPVVVPLRQIARVDPQHGIFRNNLIVEHRPTGVSERRPTSLPMRGFPRKQVDEIASFINRRCGACRTDTLRDDVSRPSANTDGRHPDAFLGFAPLETVCCPQCGYQLIGLPAEGNCPECGCRYDADSIVLEQRVPRTDLVVTFAVYPILLLSFLPSAAAGLTGPFQWMNTLLPLTGAALLVFAIVLRHKTLRTLIAVLPDGVLVRWPKGKSKWFRYDQIESLFVGTMHQLNSKRSDQRPKVIQIVHRSASDNPTGSGKRTKLRFMHCTEYDLQQLVLEANRRIALLNEDQSISSDV